MRAVILAGGQGSRLKPFTNVIPKPLLPVGDRPILEHILDKLKSHGFDEVTIATGYLSKLIQTYFGDGSNHGVKIEYSEEKKTLGTAGPLYLCRDKLNSTFLIMNGDLLTDLDFGKIMAFHKKKGALLTVALYKKKEKIDFGVVAIDAKSEITTIKEKPEVEHLVNMGIYIAEPGIFKYIPEDSYLDFPTLINKAKQAGEKVFGYVFEGEWLDIGRFVDYELANKRTVDLKKIK